MPEKFSKYESEQLIRMLERGDTMHLGADILANTDKVLHPVFTERLIQFVSIHGRDKGLEQTCLKIRVNHWTPAWQNFSQEEPSKSWNIERLKSEIWGETPEASEEGSRKSERRIRDRPLRESKPRLGHQRQLR